MSAVPTVLKDERTSIRDFLELLHASTRRHPVVLISATNMHDRPVIDADQVASWLAGLAHVYVAENRFPSLTLRDHLPGTLNCWDGAIRIYWPGLRLADPPFRHRFWSPHFIKDIEQKPGKGFKEYLLSRISTFAVFNVHSRFLTWNDILGRNRRGVLARAAEQGDFEQIAEEYAADNDDLCSRIDNLQTQLQEQAATLEQARNEADTWRMAYEQERRGGKAIEDVEAPITTVVEAVERAGTMFEEKLAFSLNSKSDVPKNPFEDPQEVFAAFTFLATTYRDAKLGTWPCPDLDHAIREAIDGWSYSGGQSDITMTRYAAWYQCVWDGRKHWLGEHLGTGSSKDPRYTIRIAFAWDEDQKKVVVGFIGQHQKTSAT